MAAILLEILHYEGSNYPADGGPTLVVLGGVHGNEPGGPLAIRHVQHLIESGALDITSGELIMLPEVNRKALQQNLRAVDRDLNRRLGMVETPSCHEDYVANQLCPILQQADFLLDLHSYESGTTPFVFLGEYNEVEHAFAKSLGAPYFAWNFDAVTAQAQDPNESIGTTSYTRKYGGHALTYECGWKKDPQAVAEVSKQGIINALSHLNMIRQAVPHHEQHGQDADNYNGPAKTIKLVQSIVKTAPGEFVQDWTSFAPIAKGAPIAKMHDGTTLTAEYDGFLIMPDKFADINTNWFYIGIEEEQRK